MKRHQARVRSIRQSADGRRIVDIHCPSITRIEAGQPLLAMPLTDNAYLRHTLYPIEASREGFRCPLPTGESWEPGSELDLLGPIGRGYKPDGKRTRWLLMAYQSSFNYLRLLVTKAEERAASVAVVSGRPIPELPEEVEVLIDAEAGIQWADYVALCLPAWGVFSLRSQFGLFANLPLPCPAEVLITDALPCGFGGCFACGLNTRNGWSLRCRQGPVFNWEELRV